MPVIINPVLVGEKTIRRKPHFTFVVNLNIQIILTITITITLTITLTII